MEALDEQLRRNAGCVSSLALRRALEQRGLPEPRALVVQLKFYNFEEPDETLSKPSFRWYTHSKSFYSEDVYHRLEQQKQHSAEVAAAAAVNDTSELSEDEEEEQAPSRERRRLRQEESRLGAYVVAALEDLYQSECAPSETEYVFDVHKERAGSEYENIDVLAVHWRSERVVELVSVEIKLEFTPRLVQQAWNYTRFSDRVWIAVPVLADATNVAQALREYDPLLFEHVVAAGLGILACRRRPGRNYDVIPVQWPRKMQPDPITKEVFLIRYRARLEAARVLAPRGRHQYPMRRRARLDAGPDPRRRQRYFDACQLAGGRVGDATIASSPEHTRCPISVAGAVSAPVREQSSGRGRWLLCVVPSPSHVEAAHTS